MECFVSFPYSISLHPSHSFLQKLTLISVIYISMMNDYMTVYLMLIGFQPLLISWSKKSGVLYHVPE